MFKLLFVYTLAAAAFAQPNPKCTWVPDAAEVQKIDQFIRTYPKKTIIVHINEHCIDAPLGHIYLQSGKRNKKRILFQVDEAAGKQNFGSGD